MTSEFYIRQVVVRLYGHLKFDGQADLSPGINVVIEKNGSGKTTILDMIRRVATEGQGLQPIQPDQENVDDAVLAKLQIERGADGPTAIEHRRSGVWSGWESLQGRVRHVTSNRSILNEMKFRNLFSGARQVDLENPADQINVADEFTKAINSELLERIREMQGGLPDITSRIESEYRSGLVDLEKDIKLDFDRDNPVYFVDYSGRELHIDNLSAGEKEFLYFFAYLRRIRNDRGKIILIDEPELHLHGSQVRKLCEMLTDLSINNQVIVATHSADVLQQFLHSGRVVLLGNGRITNVRFPEDVRELIERLGIPVDPSVFTAHWITAENSNETKLPGPNAPVTAEALAWICGRNLNRRFWGFGSSKSAAESGIELLQLANANVGDIRLTVIFDGDRLVVDAASWPPTIPNESSGGACYLPLWEIENLFLNPALLAALPTADVDLQVRLWQLVESQQQRLISSVQKTITKHQLQEIRSQHRISGTSPMDDLRAYQSAVQDLAVDEQGLASRLSELVAQQMWQWIPGKEVLGMLVDSVPKFWDWVRDLEEPALAELLSSDPDVQKLVALITERDTAGNLHELIDDNGTTTSA